MRRLGFLDSCAAPAYLRFRRHGWWNLALKQGELVTWLRDESLEDSASLPDPDVLAQEIADDLRSALGQIEDILGDLRSSRDRRT